MSNTNQKTKISQPNSQLGDSFSNKEKPVFKNGKTYFLISGSSCLGSVLSRESNNNMHGVLVFDSNLSSKLQKIRRLQWLLKRIDV